MDSTVNAEWDTLKEVVVHRPGIEMFFGLMAPFSFLYERAFSMDEAIYEHTELEHALSSAGVRVHRLKRLSINLAKENPALLERARDYAVEIVKFSGPADDAAEARRAFKKSVADLDEETVFNVLLLRPSVALEERKGVRVVLPRVTLDVPLANLYFMRDQQAVSDRGVMVGRMSKPQRQMEPLITGAILEMAGAKVALRIKQPGTFEGGDFMPAGDFAMLGLGDRTNRSGVNQILARGVGFAEVAVVHQAAHPLIPGDQPDPMINMHLDTYLNIAGRGIAVGCVPLLKRAKVEVYRRSSKAGYRRQPGSQNVYDYLVSRGFTVVPITTLEQMCYASNFLCLSDRKIMAVEVENVVEKVLNNLEYQARLAPHRYGRLFEEAKKEHTQLRESGHFFPHKKEFNDLGVEATALPLQEITGGYGGAHCMTCVLSRQGKA
ncbi:MAG: arginine deiminase family protein [Thaumarchaeota archaeon]|nr:arginine deiminase family protein [Nitrososphaerota archaeon]